MSNRRNFTTSNNIQSSKSLSTNHQQTNLDDDWETDPDFQRDMDEIEQRWGSKRTVGSIDMTKLKDEAHNDHKIIMKERFLHPSQSATIDKESTSSTIKKIITSTIRSSSTSRDKTIDASERKPIDAAAYKGSSIHDVKKNLFERSGPVKETVKSVPSTTYTRPPYERESDFQDRLNKFAHSKSHESTRSDMEKAYKSKQIHKISSDHTESRSSDRLDKFRESTLSPNSITFPSELQTNIKVTHEDEKRKLAEIQAKIEARKKELDELEKAYAKKSRLSRTEKRTHSNDQLLEHDHIEFVDGNGSIPVRQPFESNPHDSIKSIKDKFDRLLREEEEDFRRLTETRRKQFFDEIESQVHETGGINDTVLDKEFEEIKKKFLGRDKKSFSSPSGRQPSPRSPTSNIEKSYTSLGADNNQPKVYTKRETHREEVVSKIVKENDKVIENETKRNVQHSSSCHGSSDEESLITDVKTIPIRIAANHNVQSPTKLKSGSPLGSTAGLVGKQVDESVLSSKNKNPSSQFQLANSSANRNGSSSQMSVKSTANGDKGGLMARTLYQYDAGEDDELSFDVDELITNVEKIDVGWYKGCITSKNGTRREGLFPANYVKLLNDDGEY